MALSYASANLEKASPGLRRVFAGAAMGLLALGSFPAAADEVLNEAQCMSAKGATITTLREFKGKMSAPLAESFGRFATSCDLTTKFDRVPGVDDKAWDVFRVRINYIRSSGISTPASLTQQ